MFCFANMLYLSATFKTLELCANFLCFDWRQRGSSSLYYILAFSSLFRPTLSRSFSSSSFQRQWGRIWWILWLPSKSRSSAGWRWYPRIDGASSTQTHFLLGRSSLVFFGRSRFRPWFGVARRWCDSSEWLAGEGGGVSVIDLPLSFVSGS